MKVLAISGNKGHGKSMAASLLPWQFQDSRCLHLSYYDALVHISPGFIKDETEGLIAAVNSISPNFFYETVKVKTALRKGLYDYLILDDVDTDIYDVV